MQFESVSYKMFFLGSLGASEDFKMLSLFSIQRVSYCSVLCRSPGKPSNHWFFRPPVPWRQIQEPA